MKKNEVFRLRLEKPLLIEMYDAVKREKDKRESRYDSVASLIRYAVRRVLKGIGESNAKPGDAKAD